VQHKTTGNEHFKLGRYAEADAAYTAALAALPAGHIVLVTLHNNRAATRLKLGEGSTAVADCTAAIALIGPSYHPSKEAALPPGVDVKLGDALVKATVKRAQAHEMGEKWRLALEDWERVLGFDAALSPALAASKMQASEGVRRAKLALEGGSASASGSGSGSAAAAKPRPKPKPKPVRASTPTDISKSAAVSEMRAAAAAAAKEDDERAALKDSVDARVEAWKEGKETNLRALIASLDSVLWEAALAGGLKVGMHELITDKQVKIKYMRVAARLHPDKLQVASTTVEQRMLAAGTFSVLSEAWAGFNA
jgi:tetratricopeptide (TPR) repeat protein